EDGIRDKLVTGVQTCALPISPFPPKPPSASRDSSLNPCPDRPPAAGSRRSSVGPGAPAGPGSRDLLHSARAVSVQISSLQTHRRSEERRVGKECIGVWST